VAPILLGEFGSTLANPLDVQWLTTLMNYLTENGMSFTYWSWNPNSGDTGGIALDDWYSINQQKYAILQPHLVPPTGSPTGPTSSGPTSSGPTSGGPTSGGPTSNPPGSCTATYAVVNQYPGGFQAEVTVQAGSTAISQWTVNWTFTNGQTITQLWNGDLSSNGSSITVRNAPYNGSLGPNASTTFGFLGTWNSTNEVPTLTCSAS
jgi:endoglucanase